MNNTCSLRNNDIKFIFTYFYLFFLITSCIFLKCIQYYNNNLLKFKEELKNIENAENNKKNQTSWFLDTKID